MTEQQAPPAPGQGAAKPPAGTPAIVDVVARSIPGGGVGFTHSWRWQDGNPQANGRIDVPQRKKDEPGTPIHFHFRDATVPNRGLDFTDDEHGPMWVLRDRCPPDGQKCEDPEIPATKMRVSPNLLKVFDENAEACTLHYRLRFKDRRGRPEAYDPDIRNGGTI